MNIVLLQTALPLQDIEHLLHEFPHYLFLSFTEATYKNLSQDNWSQVEVLYGCRLTEEELERAHQLRWIHCPEQDLNKLCLEAIQKKGNIILTSVREENLQQIGEFVMAGVLAFSKNLFHWHEVDKHPNILWDSKWRENMWSLQGKKFFQIGLEKIGSEIAHAAEKMGMKVEGAAEKRSFHPYCRKTCTFDKLTQEISKADVVSIALPKTKEYEGIIGEKELEAIKDGAILVILGNTKVVDEEALVAISKTGKFRGVLIDAMYQTPILNQSPLWQIPNVLITPDVAPRPKTHMGQSFAIFRYNLRQYIHGNFKDMRNVLNRSEKMLT